MGHKWNGKWVLLVIVMLLCLGCVGGAVMAYANCYDEEGTYQKTLTELRKEVAELEGALIFERDYSKCLEGDLEGRENDVDVEWLKELIKNVQSANITYKYNQGGDSKGELFFYYEKH